MTEATNKIYRLYSKCYNLKHMIWEEDIPSPTVPDYVQIHDMCQQLINYINTDILSYFEQFCMRYNSPYCRSHCVGYMSFTPKGDIDDAQYKSVLNQIMPKLNNLRTMIINKDIVPKNPEQKEHHEKCIQFLHYIERHFDFIEGCIK